MPAKRATVGSVTAIAFRLVAAVAIGLSAAVTVAVASVAGVAVLAAYASFAFAPAFARHGVFAAAPAFESAAASSLVTAHGYTPLFCYWEISLFTFYAPSRPAATTESHYGACGRVSKNESVRTLNLNCTIRPAVFS